MADHAGAPCRPLAAWLSGASLTVYHIFCSPTNTECRLTFQLRHLNPRKWFPTSCHSGLRQNIWHYKMSKTRHKHTSWFCHDWSAKMSCSSRDDLWKVTTVLLKIGQKMTRIHPMPIQLGRRPMAILVICVASLELCWIFFQKGCERRKGTCIFPVFIHLENWTSNSVVQGAQSSKQFMSCSWKKQWNLRRFDQEFAHSIWTFANLGLLRKQLLIEPSCKPSSQIQFSKIILQLRYSLVVNKNDKFWT